MTLGTYLELGTWKQGMQICTKLVSVKVKGQAWNIIASTPTKQSLLEPRVSQILKFTFVHTIPSVKSKMYLK